MGMVLATDIRVAAPGAKFFYPVMKLGFLPQPSDPIRLAELVGGSRAKLLLMSGTRIDAGQAYNFGLVDMIDDDPMAAAHTLAADATQATRAHVEGIKALFQKRHTHR